MPSVSLYSKDDYANIYYVTNSENGNVGSFEPEKATAVLLHPTFLDSSWLSNQMSDKRLQSFNLIAFDMRVSGESNARASGLHDSWVDAADLALCFQTLHLPPAHIFAMEAVAVTAAIRFAALFPEMCLSLTLSNVPSPREPQGSFNTIGELMASWYYASDLETLQHAEMEAVSAIFGQGLDPDFVDDIISYWEMNMPPFRRQRIIENVNTLLNRQPCPDSVYKSITLPVLIMHGDQNEVYPKKYAQQLASELTNANGGEGAITYNVRDAGAGLTLMSRHSSLANQTFWKFASRVKNARSDIEPPSAPVSERMLEALHQLSDFMDTPSIAKRNPLSSLSFSCLPENVKQSQIGSVQHFGENQLQGFSPLNSIGRPWRRYSDRKDEHWFHGDKEGLSYAGTKAGKEEAERTVRPNPLPLYDTEPASVPYDGRVRKSQITSSTVDKHVIKGSMAKVVAANSPQFANLRILTTTS